MVLSFAYLAVVTVLKLLARRRHSEFANADPSVSLELASPESWSSSRTRPVSYLFVLCDT
jgi:hypothetical protein